LLEVAQRWFAEQLVAEPERLARLVVPTGALSG
jgi:hypothetical protein